MDGFACFSFLVVVLQILFLNLFLKIVMQKVKLTHISLSNSIGVTFEHKLMIIGSCRKVFASLPSEQAAMP